MKRVLIIHSGTGDGASEVRFIGQPVELVRIGCGERTLMLREQRLDEAASRHRVAWRWVKGHSGVPENERADELARLAIPSNA